MAFEGSGYMKGVRRKRSVAFREPLVSMESVDSASDHPSMEIAMASVSSGIVEHSPPGQHLLHNNSISERSLLSTGTRSKGIVRIDMPSNPSPTPKLGNSLGSTFEVYDGSSSNGTSSSHGLPPKPKSNFQSGTLNMEEVAILALGGLQLPPTERSLLRSSPLTRQVESINRANSMPVCPIHPSNSNAADNCCIALNSNHFLQGVGEQPIHRSHSVPTIYNDGTIRGNHVRVLRVVPNRRMIERDSTLSSASSMHNGEEDKDNITEEEAVCRICFEEIGEELETFKLECNCRGDLALVHRECSQRWFNIRGTRTCEICRAEVQNIVVKVSRRHAIDLSSLHHLQVLQPPPMVEADRLWQEFPILVVASIVGYFLSVKLFQMWRRSDKDINGLYGIPSSCILGLLTSLAASAFAQRKHVWIYALAQFVIFTVFAQIFYNLFHMETIPTIMFAIAIAMGISRGAHPVYRAIQKLRAASPNQLNNNPQDGAPPTEVDPTQEAVERHHSGGNHIV